MIDLHLHTTASDGRSTPRQLVREATAAGIRVLAVTDHDTLAGHAEAVAAGQEAGVEVIRGVELTAVRDGRDVHVLGYFVEAADDEFHAFLGRQRQDRRRRIVEIVSRLERLGVSVDPDGLLDVDAVPGGRAIGRPAVAQALIASGHVASVDEAFRRFLSPGRPAFVPRRGASPGEVVGHLVRIGAVAAVAHPGKSNRDDLLDEMTAAGMAAIEVFHPDHSDADRTRYSRFASAAGLLRTGGSDYHGVGSGRAGALGQVWLPEADYAALVAHAGRQRER